MQKLVYTVEIDEELIEIYSLLDLLDETVKDTTKCNVLRSRIESDEEMCEYGEWEDEYV